MNNGFMIKYGKKEYLQQIIDGCIRFAPSQDYIKLEKERHNKGQGDLLEGKWVIHAEHIKMKDLDTGKVIEIPTESKIVVGTVDVNNMPVFCLSHYGPEYVKKSDNKQSIVLTREKLECINRDFPDATHALIILEQDKFVKEVQKVKDHNVKDHNVVRDKIYYYDYDINDIRMASFLTTGDEMAYKTKGIMMSMTYENRYRHLMCKDESFADQSEYRFIVTDELSNTPVIYQLDFNSKYLLLPISALESPILIL